MRLPSVGLALIAAGTLAAFAKTTALPGLAFPRSAGSQGSAPRTAPFVKTNILCVTSADGNSGRSLRRGDLGVEACCRTEGPLHGFATLSDVHLLPLLVDADSI